MTTDWDFHHKEYFHNQYGSGLRFIWHVPDTRTQVVSGDRPPYMARAMHEQVTVPLIERLELIRGVGPVTAATLKIGGVKDVIDLLTHPKLGTDARAVLDALEQKDTRSLLSRGARDVDLIPLFRRRDTVLVDIETTGFSRTLPLFMIGLAVPTDTGWEIRQLLARGFEDEAAVLAEALEELEGKAVCVSYNGKAFDEPFVKARLMTYRLGEVAFRLHVDLMHACRRWFRHICPDFKLTTVSRMLFGRQRTDDVHGYEIPDLYYQFMREGTIDLLHPLLRHNAYDLADLGSLYDQVVQSDDEEMTGGERTGETG